MMPVAVLSSFIINDSIVILFVRIVKMWSRKLGLQPSKLLIPLSYAAEMGGALLILATPSGLVINGMFEKETGQGLGIFAATLPAFLCLVAGMLVLIALRKFLPSTNSPESTFEQTDDYTVEMLVTSNNPPIGTTLNLVVYGPGGYSATDFLRIGFPVKLAYMATAIIILNFI